MSNSDEIKNENIEENETNQIVDIDPDEIMKNISLKSDDEVEAEEKKRGRKPKNKDEKEIEEDLFQEFSSFLEKKADFKEEQKNKYTISTGFDLLDAILGGGFVVGALNMITGQPGSGKSMLAIQVLGQGQRQFKNKLLGGFLDSEEATTPIRLANLGAIHKQTKLLSDITVEKVFKFIEGVCLFKEEKNIIENPSIVVWDSVANTLTQKEREVDDINQVIGYKARLLSILVPRYVSKCTKYNICLIAVNQQRDAMNLGQFAPAPDLKFMSHSKTLPGGTALRYNSFHLLEMKTGQVLTQDKFGFDGVKTRIKCVKNKLFQPNIEIELLGSFNSGFSNFWTNYNFMTNNKRLSTGAWNYLVSYPDKKFRTKDAEDLYKSDAEFKQKYDEAVKETIQCEIIDKYSYKIDIVENE